jgi:hypothetical protein
VVHVVVVAGFITSISLGQLEKLGVGLGRVVKKGLLASRRSQVRSEFTFRSDLLLTARGGST